MVSCVELSKTTSASSAMSIKGIGVVGAVFRWSFGLCVGVLRWNTLLDGEAGRVDGAHIYYPKADSQTGRETIGFLDSKEEEEEMPLENCLY
jgi:hypothetical protein